jgi:two-component system chemotaxis response regulator CheB
MARARRIVVCDRSAERARALAGFLEHDPELRLAGAFADVETMLERLEDTAPDLIALDLETAGADPAAAIVAIAGARRAPVVLLGGREGRDDERVAEALAAGALEAIAEERLRLDEPDTVWATALRSRIRRLANMQLDRNDRSPAPGAGRAWRRPGGTYRAVGIGASVGGPPALVEILGCLPSDFSLPILVVQHMAPGFGQGITAWLDRSVPPPVAVAEHGMMLRPGIWMAPEGAHLRLEQTMRITLDGDTDRGPHRPSLDILLESLAAAAGSESVGVVLTGMGRDGAQGVRAIATAGGLTLAQDEQSSAVFGMPAAAIEAGAEVILPLDRLGPKLAMLRTRSAR